jgi:hypothetical protein
MEMHKAAYAGGFNTSTKVQKKTPWWQMTLMI